MKKDENENREQDRRFTVGIYCFGVIMFTALCVLIVMNLGSIFSAFGNVIDKLKSLIYGFFIAFALTPLQKWMYRYFIPLVQKLWKKFTAFLREKTPIGKIKFKPKKSKIKSRITDSKAAAAIKKLLPKKKEEMAEDNSIEQSKPDCRKTVSIILTYVTVILVVALLFVAVIPQVGKSYTDLSGSISDYVKTAQSFVDKMTDNIPVLDLGFLDSDDESQSEDTLFDLSDTINGIITESYDLLSGIAPSVINAATTFVTEAKNILLGLIISIYFVASKERLKRGLQRVLSAVASDKLHTSLNSFASLLYNTFVRFISNRFIDAIILTVIYALLLLIFGISYAPLLAVIMSIMNLIPYLGPMIGALICSFIVFVSNPPSLVLFIIIAVAVQIFDHYMIEKKLLNAGAGLPSVWIMVSVIVSGGIGGIVGMFLAVPVFGVIYALVRKAVEKAEKTKSGE